MNNSLALYTRYLHRWRYIYIYGKFQCDISLVPPLYTRYIYGKFQRDNHILV